MFVSEHLVFVELHKTGGTHIGHWLQTLVGGEQIGKHNRVPAHLRNRFMLGSVRNPWDWYVSLWAYGCGGEGSVRRQTTRRTDVRYCREQLPREMGRESLGLQHWARQLTADFLKPVDKWQAAYRSSDDPEAFREWLHLVLSPERRFDLGEGFGFSPVSKAAGLMTYRYLKLFTCLEDRLYKDRQLATLAGILAVMKSTRLVDFIVRNENLESDLMEGLNQAGISLNDDQKASLDAGSQQRINRSKRRETSYYYDRTSLNLVLEREAMIIERHGYTPPLL